MSVTCLDIYLGRPFLAKLIFRSLTTYEEIRRSYPAFKPPTELTDASQIQKWWEDEYENGTGPLHKVRYHRIILDGMC